MSCILLVICGCRDGLTSAVQLIPKLWPFLRHSIASVRRATLQTLSVLLAKEKLKVSEHVSNRILDRTFEHSTVNF